MLMHAQSINYASTYSTTLRHTFWIASRMLMHARSIISASDYSTTLRHTFWSAPLPPAHHCGRHPFRQPLPSGAWVGGRMQSSRTPFSDSSTMRRRKPLGSRCGSRRLEVRARKRFSSFFSSLVASPNPS